ncbi:MAG TPA: hypothetical protein VGM98_13320, partial [Schlesneria sp.]
MEESQITDPQLPDFGIRTWRSYTKELLIGAGSVLGVALMIVIGIYGWQSYESYAKESRDRRFYGELNSILAQIHEARSSQLPHFAPIRDRAQRIGESVAKELKDDASYLFPGRQELLFAARDEMPRFLKGNLAVVSEGEIGLARRLIDAAAALKLPPPSFPTEHPDTLAAVEELEELGAIVTQDPNRPIQPVTAISMQGGQFLDEHLDHLPHIASLEIDSSEVTDAGIQKLRQLRSLTSCALRCPQVTDAGLAHLATLPALTEIRLYDCSNVTANGVRELIRVQQLTLSSADISDQTLVALRELPDLRQLTLRSDSVTDEDMELLVNLRRLNALILSHCHDLTDEALLEIAAIPNLESLS